MKPFKTSSKPILKNVIVSWYGEITLKILKVKAHLDTSIMYTWGAKNLTRFNFDPSKIYNYHLVKNKIPHLAL